MPRATQVAVLDHRTLIHLSLQAACVASLVFSLDGRDSARHAAPPDPAVPAQVAMTDAAGATMTMRPDAGLVQLGMAVVERGEVTRVVVGSLRAELTAHGVALADDRFAFRIIAAVPAPGAAWLFLADDGMVARARSFLGPLESLGHVPQPVERTLGLLTASQGRLAIRTRDPHATLWTTDGSAPVAPAHDLPPGIVVSAAFTDADHGMIVLEGGALFRTRDGMRSFARVDLGDAAAAAVAALDGALYVMTSSGIAIFDREGALREGPGAAVVMPPSVASATALPVPDHEAVLYRRVFTAVLRRHGALVAEAFYGTITADGRPVVAVEHAQVRTLVALDGPSPAADLSALEHFRPCMVRRWGDDLGLACFDGLFRADARTLRPTLVTAESVSLDAMLSSDGVHAAWDCDHGLTSLCLLSGSRVLHHPRGSDRLLGFHGSAAVVRSQRGDAPALVLIDAATGAEGRSFALRALPSGAATAEAWQLTADGAAAIAVATAPDPGGESRLLRLALSDGAVTTVQLPRGAIRAGFVSAERGVAAGEDASTLWLTSDGGASWHARHATSGVNRSIHCGDGRCVVDDLVLVSFERPIPGATDRVLMAPEQPVPPPAYQWTGLECEANDTARPAPDRKSLCNGELDAQGRLRFHNPGVDVHLAADRDGRWTVAWRGRDWRGAYRAHAAGMVTPRASVEWLELARATRDGVVIAQQGGAGGLVWMPADGRPARVGDPELPGAAVDDVLTLPTGELAVLLRFPGRDQPDADYYRLLVVDRKGAVRARRTYFWDWDRNGAIGFLDGTAGVQWAETDPARPRWFLSVDAAAPSRVVPAVDAAAVSVCTAADAAGAVSITIEGPALQDWPADQGKAIARHYWRGDERPCLQAIEARQPRLGGRDVFVSASPRGGLRTVLDLPDIQDLRTLRCELTREDGPEPSGPGFGEAWGAWKANETCSRAPGDDPD